MSPDKERKALIRDARECAEDLDRLSGVDFDCLFTPAARLLRQLAAALATRQADLEETDPVKLDLMADPVRRAAFEAYHNTQSGHYDRMIAAVAAVLRATQQAVQAEPVAWLSQFQVRGMVSDQLNWAHGDVFTSKEQAETDAKKFASPARVVPIYLAPPAPGQVERDREDAENYRWLCSHMIVPCPSLWDKGVAFTTPPMPRKAGQMTKAELDDFIRAARSSDGDAA